MLNHEANGWGIFRKIDGKTYILYEKASYKNNKPENNKEWREKIRQEAKEQGCPLGRVLKNSFDEYAYYVLHEEQ